MVGDTVEELTSLADLLDLQTVDSEIDRLLHRRETVPELEAHRRVAHDLAEVNGQIEALEEQRKALGAEIAHAEDELVLMTEKKDREERRLYAGGLTAREATHLRDEVGMLGRQVSEKEEGLLEQMETREQHRLRLDELAAQRDDLAAKAAELQAVIDDQWREIDAELARQERRKAEIVPLVDEELLELYERLRQTSPDGVAVGPLNDGVCGCCHITLSPGERAEALHADPPRCVHCNCIIVP